MEFTFNLPKLEELLNALYELLGLKVSVIYDRSVTAVPANLCELCEYKRNTEGFFEKCRKCDYEACQAADKLDSIYIYKCHYHLTEAIRAIKINGVTAGYLMIGQMMDDRDGFIRQNNPSPEELALLDKLPTVSHSKIHAAMKLFDWLGQYLIFNEDISRTVIPTASQIENYINIHIGETISVDEICRIFHQSRTAMYVLFNKEFGMGINEYITHMKLERAKHLLRDHSVKQAANLVGIENTNYFSRIFKKKYNSSPLKYKIKKL